MGGLMGFGMSHCYPVSKETDIKKLTLKGFDAAVMNIFKTLGLAGEVKAIYEGQRMDWYSYIHLGKVKTISKKWLSSSLLRLPEYQCGDGKLNEPWNVYENQPGALHVFSIEPVRDATLFGKKIVTVRIYDRRYITPCRLLDDANVQINSSRKPMRLVWKT